MKPVRFVVAYEIEREVPDEWDDDMVAFHIEDNFCLDNHVEEIHRRIVEKPNVCHTCADGCAIVGGNLEHVRASTSLVDALLVVEWTTRWPHECPCCYAQRANGEHAHGCDLNYALNAAGLATQAERDEARKGATSDLELHSRT